VSIGNSSRAPAVLEREHQRKRITGLSFPVELQTTLPKDRR
jgi:hypothetical protein